MASELGFTAAGFPTVTLADNRYDAVGRLASDLRTGRDSLRTGFEYNLRSWLTRKGGPAFEEIMHYEDGWDPQWGGRISSEEWTEARDTSSVFGYEFCHDSYGRLIAATDMCDFWRSSTYTYDSECNMLDMQRDSIILFFGYSGNRQTSVAGLPCTYDACGRLVTDVSGALAGTVYNELGLPRTRTYNTFGGPQRVNTTVYAADGTKIASRTT